MAFDPISHAAGYGAGASSAIAAAGDARIAQLRARHAIIERNKALERVAELENEIDNKWIPYGVRLRASIIANRVQKNELIAALKASNPENADHIVQESERHADAEYNRLVKTGSKELSEMNKIVKEEAEAKRLDR